MRTRARCIGIAPHDAEAVRRLAAVGRVGRGEWGNWWCGWCRREEGEAPLVPLGDGGVVAGVEVSCEHTLAEVVLAAGRCQRAINGRFEPFESQRREKRGYSWTCTYPIYAFRKS